MHSDGHGFQYPHGSVGMGMVGMGVGNYFFTHTNPTPIAVGVVGSHGCDPMGLMVEFFFYSGYTCIVTKFGNHTIYFLFVCTIYIQV